MPCSRGCRLLGRGCPAPPALASPCGSRSTLEHLHLHCHPSLGQISCCFDLPLTSAVAAGKADPIDWAWVMIFSRLPQKLLIVHTAIYSIPEQESEGLDGLVRGYLHTQLTLQHFK